MSLLLIALLGCTPAVEDTGDADIPLLGVLGTGEWEWAGIEDGDEVPVIMGPQGGYHLLASVRVSGIQAGDPKDLSNPDNPTTSFSVWHEDTNLTAASVFVQGLDPANSESLPYRHEMIGRFAILDIVDDSELDGTEVRFVARVEDVNGNVVEDERVVKTFPHPNNQ
jgi:hypothetical protein